MHGRIMERIAERTALAAEDVVRQAPPDSVSGGASG
jgi:hypothetical protein